MLLVLLSIGAVAGLVVVSAWIDWKDRRRGRGYAAVDADAVRERRRLGETEMDQRGSQMRNPGGPFPF